MAIVIVNRKEIEIGDKERPMKLKLPALAPEAAWSAYLATLAVLTAMEAYVQPELQFIDRALDIGILAFAFLGCLTAFAVSTRTLFKECDKRESSLVFRVGAEAFCGPTAGLIVVLAINSLLDGDVDGGLLLVYLPFLGIVLAVIALPLMVLNHKK